MKKLLIIIGIVSGIALNGFSQLISVTPALPTDQDNVEVIFDASLGNGGLKDYSGDIYAHTGVFTSQTTGWNYVITPWPNSTNLSEANTDKNKLISLGNNKWKLVIGPSIRSYYNVPEGDVIKSLAFVFRSADGSKEGKTDAGGDIFYDVFPSSINVQITNPSTDYLIADFNDTFTVEASSLLADSTLLFIDGLRVAATNTNQVSYAVTASSYGTFQVVAMAKTLTESAFDTLIYYVRPAVTVAELPAGMKDGINYLSETSVLLSLYAPLKHFADVIGDFNNWQPNETSYMKQTPDAKRYWIQIDNLVPGKEYIYQYFIDGSIRIGDPYAAKVSDPWNDKYIDNSTYPNMLLYPAGKTQGIATVLQTARQPYVWTSTSYTPPAVTDMVIYEVLLRDFSAEHSFQSLIDSLGYLKNLGINTIELMPVNEFEGNLSWGYNTNYYFAVDKYYGHADDFKKLIDICHQNGISVIMDIVFNHAFGTSPYVLMYWDAANNRPSAESPFYNIVAKHDYNVGFDMNHETDDTKQYVSRAIRFWIEEFRIDGYRFDLSKGFTQKNTLGNTGAWGNYDASRISILTAYHDTLLAANPKALLILEHFADNDEEKLLASKNMLLWGNMNYNYGEAAKGVTANSNISWGSYTSRSWSNPNLVTYMESHDEEREMFRCIKEGRISGSYSIKDTATALKRMALNAAFFFTIPGPKMIWQFGERGYDYSINYPSGTESSRLDNKPPRWDYLNNAERIKLFDEYSKLIHLKKHNPLFKTTDFQLDVAGAVKKITLTSEGKTAIVLGNFDVISSNVSAGFPHTGTWYDYMSGDSLVLDEVNLNYNLIFKAGEYRLYLSEKFSETYGISSEKKEPFSVNVSPNPVSVICTIEVKYLGSAKCEIWDYNLLGSESDKVFSGTINNRLQLPWTPKGKGIHVLQIRIGNQQVTRKVVVQ